MYFNGPPAFFAFCVTSRESPKSSSFGKGTDARRSTRMLAGFRSPWGHQKGGLANLRFIVFHQVSLCKNMHYCFGQWSAHHDRN